MELDVIGTYAAHRESGNPLSYIAAILFLAPADFIDKSLAVSVSSAHSGRECVSVEETAERFLLGTLGLSSGSFDDVSGRIEP